MLLVLAAGWGAGAEAQVASRAPISGEIEQLSLTNPADIYSGGTIVVGGQNVILPRNLLIDLPANRLTLQQIFEQAPAECVAAGQSGLAKGDSCNISGTGGFATISANRTSAGNVIAGDVFIEKGRETLAGVVTFISYSDGYFRVNGTLNDPTTGVMVRLNDPTGRHTIQQGAGCLPGSPNCSPDPRFTLDPDNYTNAFSTGYPMCIPSTTSRPFPGLPGIAGGTAVAAADGSGDLLCPTTNRTVNNGQPVQDSRRFAPVIVGDNVVAEGNFETIGGVRFLSSHTTRVAVALGTNTADATQPDYLFMEEVFVDTMGFNNQRARALFIGFSTGSTDMRIWSIHRDPVANAIHEFPLASVAGCDAIGGGCGANGLVGGPGGNIFKIRYDVDFIDANLITKKPELYPCPSLRADPDWAALNICGAASGSIAANFGILSPTPHEIIVRSRLKTSAPAGSLITLDVNGNEATNGEYLFPLGINLGGLETPEFVEINLGALGTPWLFTGVPWNLDRRLGPGGCLNGGCEPGGPGSAGSLTFALDPFPFEGLDPRTNETTLPTGAYNDPNYVSGSLGNVRNRILSYVNAGIGNFTTTILPWPPANPSALPITATPIAVPCAAGAGGGVNTPATANADSATAPQGTAIVINVVANDTGSLNVASLSVSAVSPVGAGSAIPNPSGSITFTPAAGFSGTASFAYTIQDLVGTVAGPATVTVTVLPGTGGLSAPVVTPPANITLQASLCSDGIPSSDQAILVFIANATASDLEDGNVSASITNNAPAVFPVGTTTVTFTARDSIGLLGSANATVTVLGTPNTAPTVTAPAPITLTAPVGSISIPSSDPAIIAFLGSATVTDSESNLASFTNNAPASFPVGTTTVTFTATDNCSATTTATSSVTINPSVPVDLDIASFTTTTSVRRTLGQRVAISLRVRNGGRLDAPMPATVVGVQNGVTVYQETLLVNAPVGGVLRAFTFPSFTPTAAGNITWTVTIQDTSPDVDRAIRTTRVL